MTSKRGNASVQHKGFASTECCKVLGSLRSLGGGRTRLSL